MRLKFFKAFSLIELSIALAILAILTSSIVPIVIRSLEIKAAEKIVLEMAMIQQASQNYYADQNSWPSDISALQAGSFLNPAWNPLNPWHNPYQITNNGLSLTVSTDLPALWAALVASRLPSTVITNISAATKNVASTVLMQGGGNIPSGTIVPLTTNSIPSGWLLCDGQAVSRITYSNLFNVIGVRFGVGDGVNTFTLPDLRGRTVVGLDNMGGHAASVITAWPQAQVLGGSFGEEKHQLSIAEMPSHHFNIMINDTTTSGGPIRYPETVNVTSLKPYSTNTLGNDQPHNVVQPSIALNWIIKI